MAQVRAAVGGIVGRSPAGGKVIDMSNEGGKYVARVPHGELDESDQRYLDMFFDRMELVKQQQEESLEGLKQAREVQKYGGALPGTPQWEDSWQKVKANDLQGRVLTNVLGQLDDLSKPSSFNPPQGVEGIEAIPESASLGKNFSRESGFYQTKAPVRQGGRLIDAGAFSNIGSRPGPAKINTPEGEAQFEGLKAITGAITGKGEGKIDRFKETPGQKFAAARWLAKDKDLREQTDITDPDGTKRAALKEEMKKLEQDWEAERAKLGPNAGGFPKQEKEAWPGRGEEKPTLTPKGAMENEQRRLEEAQRPREGQTATNKQTGEKIVYQGGQWVPSAATPKTETSPLQRTEMTPAEQENVSAISKRAKNRLPSSDGQWLIDRWKSIKTTWGKTRLISEMQAEIDKLRRQGYGDKAKDLSDRLTALRAGEGGL